MGEVTVGAREGAAIEADTHKIPTCLHVCVLSIDVHSR